MIHLDVSLLQCNKYLWTFINWKVLAPMSYVRIVSKDFGKIIQ